jgi:hypothetical protein
MPPAPYIAPGFARPKVTPAAATAHVQGVIEDIAYEAAVLPERYVRSLAPIMRQAQGELAGDLRVWLASHAKDGNERFTAQRYRQALLQLGHAMDTLGNRLGGKDGALAATLKAQGAGAGALALSHLEQEVAGFSAVFGHSVRPLQLPQAAILAKGDKLLIPRYRNSAARYGKAMTDDIRRELAVGVIRGETFDELTTRLVKMRGPRGLVSLRGLQGSPGAHHEVIAEGLFVRYRGWAERIVRTEAMNAYNEHAQNGLAQLEREDPGWVQKWDATVDARGCEICRGLHGATIGAPGAAKSLRDLPSASMTPEERQARTMANSLEADRLGDEFEEAAREWKPAEVRNHLAGEGVPGARELPDDLGSAVAAYKQHLFQQMQAADEAFIRGDIGGVPDLPALSKRKAAIESGAREVGRAVQDADRLQREVLEDLHAVNQLQAKLVEVEDLDVDDDAFSVDDEEFSRFAGRALQGSRGLQRSASDAVLKKIDREIEADTIELYSEISSSLPDFGDLGGDELRSELDDRLARLKTKLPELAQAQAKARAAMKALDKVDDVADLLDPDDDDLLETMVRLVDPEADDPDGKGADFEAKKQRYDVAHSAARLTIDRERDRLIALDAQWDFDEAVDDAADAEKETKRLIKAVDKYKPPERKAKADEDGEEDDE